MNSFKIFPQTVIDSRESSDNIVTSANDSFSFPIGDTMQRWKVVRAIDGATLCKGNKWRMLPMESEIMTYSSCGRAMKYGFSKVTHGKHTTGNIIEWATATRIDNNN